MTEIPLENPCHNGVVEPDPGGEAFISVMHEVWELWKAGKPIYVKYLDGDRKGSIARFEVGDDRYSEARWFEEPKPHRTDVWSRDERGRSCTVYGYRYYASAYGVCHWDGRRNKVKASLGYEKFAWLKDYDGPTVWKKFDAKAAREKMLRSPGQKDIDGNVLAVGDAVLYVNIRYGGGTLLCHGTILRFKAKANSRRKSIETIVVKDGSDEESCITDSSQLIWKKGVAHGP